MIPPRRHFRILVNPLSGSGAAPDAVAAVERLLVRAGAGVTVVESRSAEHARAEVASAVAAGEVVVAAGGDGMLASLAGAVVEAGGVLGVVPSGRGNDFARMLRLSSRTEDVAHVLLEGDPTPVDVIDVGGHVVLGSLYCGVDSLASEIVDRSRHLPAALQYPYAAVRSLLTYRPARFRITVDGRTEEHDAYNVVVANSAYYGKGMRIAPGADVHDGLLDVVMIGAVSRWRMVSRYPKVYAGSHVELADVRVTTGRVVEVSADREVLGYGDGERVGPLPVRAEVRPGALQVLLA